MKRALIAALALAPLAFGATATSTTVPEPPRYEGSITATSSDSSATYPAYVDVTCVDATCSAEAWVDADGDIEPITGAQRLPIVGGVVDEVTEPVNDVCDDHVPSGSVHLEFVADRVEVSFAITISAEHDCGDGYTVYFTPTQLTGTLELVSGDACLAEGSCAVLVSGSDAAPSSPRPANDPGTFSEVATIGETGIRDVVWAVVGSIVLVLLVALPTALLDSVADRLTAGSERRKPFVLRGWPAALGGLAVAGILSAFVDPALGPDLAGLRTLVSVLLALGVAVALGWLVVLLVSRRTHPDSPRTLEFRPLTLVIVVVAVVFSRLTGFEPGLVFGLVAGVVLGGALGAADRARFALLGLGWAFGIGLVCWIVYSLLPSDAPVLVTETLSAVTVAGFAALPIALLPLRGLVGRDVWEWRKPVWAGAYALGMAAFLLAVLRAPFAWDEVHASVWAWGGLFAAYAVGAIVLWVIVTRPWKRSTA